MAFQLLVLVLYPTVIAPLFNKFEPLPAGSARARIEALLARCGFSSAGLFVMDGSRRSGHGNAYFTGLGHAKRVVFFDTLLARLDGDELEAVLAHELGHFKLRHIAKRIAWSAAASLAFLALLAWLAGKPWFYAGLGIPADLLPAALARPGVALALFALVLPVFTFALAPLAAQYSRRHEFEADAFAASIAGGPALVRALVKLYEDNAATLTPDPVHSAFYDSHPPAVSASRDSRRSRQSRRDTRDEPTMSPRTRLFLAAWHSSPRWPRPATALPRRTRPLATAMPPPAPPMHEKDCVACHVRRVGGDGTKMYTRAERKVTTPAKLTQCAVQLRARHRLFPGGGRPRRRLPRSPVLQVQGLTTCTQHPNPSPRAR